VWLLPSSHEGQRNLPLFFAPQCAGSLVGDNTGLIHMA
jgi:hypothetical protein